MGRASAFGIRCNTLNIVSRRHPWCQDAPKWSKTNVLGPTETQFLTGGSIQHFDGLGRDFGARGEKLKGGS